MKTILRVGILSSVLASCTTLASAQVFTPVQGTIDNVVPSRDGTTFTVTYDLTSPDAQCVFKVAVMVSMNGKPFIKPTSLTGDVGDVVPGTRKKLVWQASLDTDNQDYNAYKFDVTASGCRLIKVPNENPGSTARTPASDLRGRWLGTYANSAMAELTIDRQDGEKFSGLLRVAMKKDDDPTELSVEGTVAAQLIAIREVSVIKPGKLKTWNLGAGSGSIQTDGQNMNGTGKDPRTNYNWSFSRQSAGATAPPAAATSQPAPAKAPANVAAAEDLRGVWEGMYAGFAARLTVSQQTGNSFKGLLSVTTSPGKAMTELQVEIIMTGEAVAIRETKVIAKGAVSHWNLGNATGTFNTASRQMSGTGRDSRSSFEWSMKRMSPLLDLE